MTEEEYAQFSKQASEEKREVGLCKKQKTKQNKQQQQQQNQYIDSRIARALFPLHSQLHEPPACVGLFTYYLHWSHFKDHGIVVRKGAQRKIVFPI